MGIDKLTAIVVAVSKLVQDIKDGILKHLWDLVVEGEILYSDWEEALAQAENLTPDENAALAAAVVKAFADDGVTIPNGTVLVTDALAFIEAGVKVAKDVPHKS